MKVLKIRVSLREKVIGLSILLTVFGAASAQAGDEIVLNETPLSQLPQGTVFSISQDLTFSNSGKQDLVPENTTLLGMGGKIVGSNQLFVPLSEMAYPISRDQLQRQLSQAIGKSDPDAGVYCYLNVNADGKLATDGRTVNLFAGRYRIEGCAEKEAVGSVTSNGAVTFSYSFFGSTNHTKLAACSLTWESGDRSKTQAPATLGCVAYHTEKTISTYEFFRALGIGRSGGRFVDPRTPEQIEAEAAKVAQAAAEKERKEKEFNAVVDRYEASRGWSNEALEKMPRYDDPHYLQLVQDDPSVKDLHDACFNDTVRGQLKYSSMPESCVEFFKVWKK